MSEIGDLIKSLPDLIKLKPATSDDINSAERELGVQFAVEYKEYLKAFGAILADGIELTGIAKAKYRNVVPVTKQEWELNPKVPNTMYVVENAGIDGIIIWQDRDGTIYQSQPNVAPVKIAESLYNYIANLVK